MPTPAGFHVSDTLLFYSLSKQTTARKSLDKNGSRRLMELRQGCQVNLNAASDRRQQVILCGNISYLAT